MFARVITGCAAGAAMLSGLAALAQPPTIRAEVYATGFTSPLAFAQDPGDPSVQYVVEKAGVVKVIHDGQVLATPFIDLTDRVISSPGARGLLGFALSPDYPDSGRFYVNYTNLEGHTTVSRLLRSDTDPFQGDPDSEEILMLVEQPFFNHNGAPLEFGPDGMLYIGMGDGGNNVGSGNGQNPNTVLGKILRIDVSPATGYTVPADNPFVDDLPIDAVDEIWAFGLRMPWKLTFDDPALGGTGALVVCDVGQNDWEEISYEPAGAGARNYGWRNKEGPADYDNSLPPAYEPLHDPLIAYEHPIGECIICGYVYRGTKLGAEYQGRLFYADHAARRVWSAGLAIDANGEATVTDTYEHTADFGGGTFLGSTPAFGVDSEGELYLVRFNNGRVFRILPEDNTDLADLTIVKGTLLAGDLASLDESDDNRLRVRSQFGFSAFEPNIVEIQVGAQTVVSTPIRLDVVIEGSVDQPGGTGTLRVFDYSTNGYVSAGTYPLSTSEQVVAFEHIEDPADKVRSSDGRVEVRVKNVLIATFSLLGFESRLDQVRIDVY